MSAKGQSEAKGNGHAPDGPGPKVKGEGSKALAQLVELIQERIAENPFERDGKVWCKDAYGLAPALDVSERTLRRYYKNNPTVFKLQPVVADGRRVALVRLAEEGEQEYSPTQEAKYLAKIWESRIGKPHTPKEFGMLYHFAQACPAGKAGEIFKLVLKEWGAFMSIVKSSPEYMHFAAMVKWPTESEHGVPGVRFYRYPRLRIIRRFAHLAVDLWVQEQQSQGKDVDPGLYSQYALTDDGQLIVLTGHGQLIVLADDGEQFLTDDGQKG
jgi:hypothetical protein